MTEYAIKAALANGKVSHWIEQVTGDTTCVQRMELGKNYMNDFVKLKHGAKQTDNT